MKYTLTDHAGKVLEERQILAEWLERTLNDPTMTEGDPADESLERRYRAIAEADGRVLRVVINASVEPVRVVSVFFDRRMRGKV